MKRIGILGEDPYDTSSIKVLLEKAFADSCQFLPLLKGVRGSQLDNRKAKAAISIELKKRRCDLVVVVRDLDGLSTSTDLVAGRMSWFKGLDILNGCFLLNIWEMEAMIFADIEVFNRKYGTTLKGDRDPMFIEDPKGKLISATYKSKRKFAVSDCPEIFGELAFNSVVERCKFFRDFVERFEAAMN